VSSLSAPNPSGRPPDRERRRPGALHGIPVLFADVITLVFRVLAGAGAGGVTPAEGQPQSVVR